MKSEGGNGFVSLVWNGGDEALDNLRVSLQMASSKERGVSWAGDCCDDGCESS